MPSNVPNPCTSVHICIWIMCMRARTQYVHIFSSSVPWKAKKQDISVTRHQSHTSMFFYLFPHVASHPSMCVLGSYVPFPPHKRWLWGKLLKPWTLQWTKKGNGVSQAHPIQQDPCSSQPLGRCQSTSAWLWFCGFTFRLDVNGLQACSARCRPDWCTVFWELKTNDKNQMKTICFVLSHALAF